MAAWIRWMRFSGLGWVLKNSGGLPPCELWSRIFIRAVIDLGSYPASGTGETLGQLLLGDVLGPMPADDMPGLVTQHSRKLAVGLEPP